MAEQGKLQVRASARILRYDENNNLIGEDLLPVNITPEELMNVLTTVGGEIHGTN